MPKHPKKKRVSIRSLGVMVDRLGELDAQMAEMKQEKEKLKKTLKDSGKDVIEGEMFRAKISVSSPRRVDWDSLIEDYGIPQDEVEEYAYYNEEKRLTITHR